MTTWILGNMAKLNIRNSLVHRVWVSKEYGKTRIEDLLIRYMRLISVWRSYG